MLQNIHDLIQVTFFMEADEENSGNPRLALSYNHFHNILRISDVLPNFTFTSSEAMCDYYL